MNIEQARFNMIEQQIRPWDVLDQDILELLLIVKREGFVPEAYKSLAFSDTEIPLPCGQHMFTPKLEARLLQAAAIKKHESALEIGAGSGYMAALMGHKARHVTTIEIEPALKDLAEKNLKDNGIDNVDVVEGDGAQGWAGNALNSAPYDVIMVSGALPVLPESLLQQLKVGGRLIAIIGEAPVMTAQMTTRTADTTFESVNLFETNVAPLRNAVKPSAFVF